MKRLLGCFLLFVFVFNTYAVAPLVYKNTTSITDDSKVLVDLGSLDTSKFSRVRVNIKISDATINYKSSDEMHYYLLIESVEDGETVMLYSQKNNYSFTTVLDTPPSRIRVRAWGKGSYQVYVYATQ